MNNFCDHLYATLYAISYHLYDLKIVKNTHERVLPLVKLQAKPATLPKVALFQGCFHVFKIVQMVSNRAERLVLKM